MFLGSRARPARRAGTVTAICGPSLLLTAKMGKPLIDVVGARSDSVCHASEYIHVFAFPLNATTSNNNNSLFFYVGMWTAFVV
jgi:hypothetical protein